MMSYNFTDQLRQVLQIAREEATRLHHPHVDAEHILLGVLAEGQGVAKAVLDNLNIDTKQLKRAVETAVPPGKAGDAGPDLPYTPRGKKVLESAMAEARQLGHSYVGTEHLLMGLVRTERTAAAAALASAGATVEATRAEVVRLLGDQLDSPPRFGHEPLARRALIVATAALAVALLALLLAVAK